MTATANLRESLDDALDVAAAGSIAAPFLAQLARPERGARAVVLYGSCLWGAPNSHPDFFVVVDSLRAWHKSFWHSLLNAVLPPSIYRLRAGALVAKVSVLSTAQLKRQCSPAASDLHHLGRLSKRVALVWARDLASRQRVIEAQEAALTTLARLARSRLGDETDVDEFMKIVLGLSYEAEVRIAEHGKVAKLFNVERAHYRAVGGQLLRQLGGINDGQRFRLPPARGALEVGPRLARSRRRAVLRWPKYLYTYDGWLDYVAAKLARNGNQLSLTPLQRRYPLLLGAPVLWRLTRAGRLT
jgi:hypothetical protein